MQNSIIAAILTFASFAQAFPSLTKACPAGMVSNGFTCSCQSPTVLSKDGKSCVAAAVTTSTTATTGSPAGASAGSGGIVATAVAPALPAATTLGPNDLNSANLENIVLTSISQAMIDSNNAAGAQYSSNALSPSFYSQCCSYFNASTVQSSYIDQSVVAGLLAHSDISTWSSAEALTDNSMYLGSNQNVAGAMIASYCTDSSCTPQAGKMTALTLCPTGLGKGAQSICQVSLTLTQSQITSAQKSASASASQGWSANFAQYVTWSYSSTVSTANSYAFLCIGEGGITTVSGTPTAF